MSLYTMVASVNVVLEESDIIRLMLEYLSSHGLMISLLTLERESGIVNGKYSEEGHFLRRLVLDGQWSDVLSFIQPLSTVPTFDMKQLLYLIHKQRYFEMLSVKSELHPENHDALVYEMVKCAAGLEKLCPSKADYDNLCALLTLSNLSDHVDYKQWNLLSARVECFENIYSLIAEFLPFEKYSTAANCVVSADRLIHLLVKGLLYESCSEFCLSQATAGNFTFEEQPVSSPMKNATLTDSDLCLVSWLSVLPSKVFSYSFERKSLQLNMKALVQPEIQWTDHIRNPLNSKVLSLSSLGSSGLKSSSLGFEKKNDDEKPCIQSLPSSSSALQSSVSTSFKLFEDERNMVNTSVDQLFETNEGSSVKKTIPLRQSSMQQNPRDKKIATKIYEKGFDREQPPQLCFDQKQLDKATHKNCDKPLTEDNKLSKNKDWDRAKGLCAGQTNQNSVENVDLRRAEKRKDKTHVPKFVELMRIEDSQVIRAAAFHPDGHLYAVGSNSKVLRVCHYPSEAKVKEILRKLSGTQPVDVACTSAKHHRGSIYCVSWNENGNLIATGSNDKTMRVSQFCCETLQIVGKDTEILCHDGTVRDMVFLDDHRLISGGAGDCKVYVTDCKAGKTVQSLACHSGHIFSLCGLGKQMVVSGSQDGTACIWDLRSASPVCTIPSPSKGSAFASVAVNSCGTMLASGHEDSTCMMWDIRKSCQHQSFTPHSDEVRSVRFSPDDLQLLTGSYDQTVKIADLSDDATSSVLSSVVVAEHKDKVIQCRWHPIQKGFITTSVDKSVVCWVLHDAD